MREILLTVLVALAAYLLGCFSTGTIISNAQGVNIRNEGSKNTGASNALRVLGLKGGAIVFLGDFIKATIAVFIGKAVAITVGHVQIIVDLSLGDHQRFLAFR